MSSWPFGAGRPAAFRCSCCSVSEGAGGQQDGRNLTAARSLPPSVAPAGRSRAAARAVTCVRGGRRELMDRDTGRGAQQQRHGQAAVAVQPALAGGGAAAFRKSGQPWCCGVVRAAGREVLAGGSPRAGMQPRYGTSAPGGSARPPYVESVPGEHPYVDNRRWRRAVRGAGRSAGGSGRCGGRRSRGG